MAFKYPSNPALEAVIGLAALVVDVGKSQVISQE